MTPPLYAKDFAKANLDAKIHQLFYYALGLVVLGLLLAVVEYMSRTDLTLYLTSEQLEQYADGALRIKGEK